MNKEIVTRTNIELLSKFVMESAYILNQKRRIDTNENSIHSDNGYYKYVPSSAHLIHGIIIDIVKNFSLEQCSFIDIGSGYPFIPLLMRILGMKKVAGLEYDEKIHSDLNLSKYDTYFFKEASIDMIHGDLLTYNFNNYDVLYAYVPIANRNLMEKGFQNILETMKVGAFFYFNGPRYAISREDIVPLEVNTIMRYQKIKTRKGK